MEDPATSFVSMAQTKHRCRQERRALQRGADLGLGVGARTGLKHYWAPTPTKVKTATANDRARLEDAAGGLETSTGGPG